MLRHGMSNQKKKKKKSSIDHETVNGGSKISPDIVGKIKN